VFTEHDRPVKNLRHAYQPVLAKAGIPRVDDRGQRVNWHSLRHTFGSLLGAAGADPETLRELMGHADLATTQRYLHTDQDRKRAAVELLARAQ
jgi:site-specific recombinase XerD